MHRGRHYPTPATWASALNLVPTAANTPRTAAPNVPNLGFGAQPGANRGNFTSNGTSQRLRAVQCRVRRLRGCDGVGFWTLWQCPAGRGIAIAQENPRPGRRQNLLCEEFGQIAGCDSPLPGSPPPGSPLPGSPPPGSPLPGSVRQSLAQLPCRRLLPGYQGLERLGAPTPAEHAPQHSTRRS